MTKLLPLSPKWINKLALLLSGVTGALLYLRLGRDAIFDWDEGIYATLGSELLRTKNFLFASWNGSVWLEKPPGIAWMSGLGQAIAGHSAYGARLLQPVCAALVLYLVYRIGEKLAGWRVGLMSFGLLAGFDLFLGRARAVNTDMPLLAGIAGVILLLLTDASPLAVAVVIAVSVWFKGLAAGLTVLIALPLLIPKGKKYVMQTALWTALFVIPWHALALAEYRNTFLTPYFREQVIQRIATPIEFHVESRWYYVSYLYADLGLGAVIVAGLGAALTLWRLIRHQKTWNNLLLLWWVVLPLALFTVAKTRLFWYILPVYPAVAILAAQAIDFFAIGKTAKIVVTVLAIGICAQGMLTAYRSVEPDKVTAVAPDREEIARELSTSTSATLAVLVPPSEREAMAVLPASARLSSSFRYGGMPSVVFYYQHPVKFFYDPVQFQTYWSAFGVVGMVAKDDVGYIPAGYHTLIDTPTYLAIGKGAYALR